MQKCTGLPWFDQQSPGLAMQPIPLVRNISLRFAHYAPAHGAALPEAACVRSPRPPGKFRDRSYKHSEKKCSLLYNPIANVLRPALRS